MSTCPSYLSRFSRLGIIARRSARRREIDLLSFNKPMMIQQRFQSSRDSVAVTMDDDGGQSFLSTQDETKIRELVQERKSCIAEAERIRAQLAEYNVGIDDETRNWHWIVDDDIASSSEAPSSTSPSSPSSSSPTSSSSSAPRPLGFPSVRPWTRSGGGTTSGGGGGIVAAEESSSSASHYLSSEDETRIANLLSVRDGHALNGDREKSDLVVKLLADKFRVQVDDAKREWSVVVPVTDANDTAGDSSTTTRGSSPETSIPEDAPVNETTITENDATVGESAAAESLRALGTWSRAVVDGAGTDPSSLLSPEDERRIQILLRQKDDFEANRDYDGAARVPEQLAAEFNVKVDPATRKWWVVQQQQQVLDDDDRVASPLVASVAKAAPRRRRVAAAPPPWTRVDDDTDNRTTTSTPLPMLSAEEENAIHDLLRERDTRRQNRDFDGADRIQDRLARERNVVLDNRKRRWTLMRQWTRLDDVDEEQSGALSAEEETKIEELLREWNAHRLHREYDDADRIRDRLADEFNVGMYVDKRRWFLMKKKKKKKNKKGWTTPISPHDDWSRVVSSLDPYLSPEDESRIRALLKQRDDCEANRDYDGVARIPEQLAAEFNVKLDATARKWWVVAVSEDQQEEVVTSAPPSVAGTDDFAWTRIIGVGGGEEEEESTPLSPEDEATIEGLLQEMTRHQLCREFDEADRIRARLAVEFNVGVRSRTMEWSILRRWTRRLFGGDGAARSSSSLSSQDEAIIAGLLAEREGLKFSRYDKGLEKADSIQKLLEDKYHVQIRDDGGKKCAWWVVTEAYAMSDDHHDSAAPYCLDPETRDYIQDRVAKRALARLKKDYVKGNGIKKELKRKYNVSIDDRSMTWSIMQPTAATDHYYAGPPPSVGTEGGGVPAWTRSKRTYARKSAPLLSAQEETAILAMLHERDFCKRSGFLDRADRIQHRLAADFNVAVNDRVREWFVMGEWTRGIGDDESELSPQDERRITRLLRAMNGHHQYGEFDKANRVRDRLSKEFNVAVFDRTRQWRVIRPPAASAAGAASDDERHRSASVSPPSSSDATGTDGASAAAAAAASAWTPSERMDRAARPLSPREETKILAMLRERDIFKRNGDYDKADRIQDRLSAEFNVAVLDRTRQWFVMGEWTRLAPRGQESASSAPLSQKDESTIAKLLNLRNRYQLFREYDEADRIRDRLESEFNVGIKDRTREWFVMGGWTRLIVTGEEESAALVSSQDDRAKIEGLLRESDRSLARREHDGVARIRNELAREFNIGIRDHGGERYWFFMPEWDRLVRVVGGKRGGSSSLLSAERGEDNDDDGDQANIVKLLRQIENHRFRGEFQEAEAIVDFLADEFHVEVDRENRKWWIVTEAYAMSDHSAAPYLDPETETYIQEQVAKRAFARLNKDHVAGDAIGDELKEKYNVFIDDYSMTWSIKRRRQRGAGCAGDILEVEAGNFCDDDSSTTTTALMKDPDWSRVGGVGGDGRSGFSSLSPEDERSIRTILRERDDCEANRDHDRAARIREFLADEFKVEIDTAKREWWRVMIISSSDEEEEREIL